MTASPDSSFLTLTVFCVALAAAIFLLARRLGGSAEPRGLHAGKAAQQWAEEHYPAGPRPVAAFVAELLHEQVGLPLNKLEKHSRFTEDLRMKDLEPVELVLAIEEDLGMKIHEDDCDQLLTIDDLVQYLERRLQTRRRILSAGDAAT